LLGPWLRWDACWYLRIASVGYSLTDGTTAFFPLYPLLLRWLGPLLGGDHLLAAAVISHTACLLAMLLLYQITRQELDHDCARRAVIYQLFFPTAFFLFAPYTESLFMLWAIACLLAARRETWWLAGLCGLLAGLTRVTGALLILPVAVEMRSRYGSLRKLLHPRALWLGLIPLGVMTYSLYLALAFGDPFLWLHSQAAWNRSLAWPWEMIHQIATNLLQPLNNSVDALFGLLFIVLMVLALRKLKAALGVYVGISLLPLLFLPIAGAPLQSMQRYVLVLFPGFMVLAWLGKRPAWHRHFSPHCMWPGTG
jgi:Gpi18-like mannosyltransferase